MNASFAPSRLLLDDREPADDFERVEIDSALGTARHEQARGPASPRYQRDATKGELLPSRAHVTDDGKPVPANDPRLANLPACGAFDVNFATRTSTYFVPRDAVCGDTLERSLPTASSQRIGSSRPRLKLAPGDHADLLRGGDLTVQQAALLARAPQLATDQSAVIGSEVEPDTDTCCTKASSCVKSK